MELYKILSKDNGPIYGNPNFKWSLPRGKRPGEWMPPINGELVLCENGYHACRRGDLLDWLGPNIYELEYRGEIIEGGGKVVVSEARLTHHFKAWNEQTARLFACDCAAHVLYIYEKHCKDDRRIREGINLARRFAKGKATQKELTAARTAAWEAAGAAWAAAGAARAAAGAAWAAGEAAGAAWAAAWAARAAAGAAWAAGAAARDAEIEWQTRKLFEYLNGKRG
jgi:hypothetical protein